MVVVVCDASGSGDCGKRHYTARSTRETRGSENESGKTSKYVPTPVVSERKELRDGVGRRGDLLIGYECDESEAQVSEHESRV